MYGSYVINFSYIYYDLSNWFSFLGGKHISKILDDVAFGERHGTHDINIYVRRAPRTQSHWGE